MVLPIGGEYEKYCSVHFPHCIGFFSSLLYGPHSRKLWYVGRGSTLISSEKLHFPLGKYTRNIFLYIIRAVSEFSFLLHKSCNRKLWYVGSGFMRDAPKNGTSHWMRIRKIVFCIFSGQHGNFCSLRRSVATGNYEMLEEILGGNPPKNGTSHWTSLLGMFFCTFSGQYRNFRSFCTGLVAGNYDMLEVVSCRAHRNMILSSGRAY